MRPILIVPAAAAALALLASHGGALHPAGDALAVFRGQIALGLAVFSLALLLLRVRAGALGLAAALAAVAPIALQALGGGAAPAGGVSLYQKNLSFRLPDPQALVADIRAADPDMLTLQEVTDRNAALLGALAEDWPYRRRCGFAAVGGVALVSRWPFVPGSVRCHGGLGLISARVETPAGPVTLASLHLHWPWPRGQAQQVAALEDAFRALERPVLLAGDFNMVPWSATVRGIARATGTARADGLVSTFPRFEPWAPLPIDHVLVPEGAAAEVAVRPLAGSDHRGLLARIGPLR